MEHKTTEQDTIITKRKRQLYTLSAWLLGALILAALVYSYREIRYIVGQPVNSSYITVVGKGEISTPPDIAEVSFTVRETNPKVSEAQKTVKDKTVAAGEALKKLNIEDKDILTENYSSYPKYEYNPQNGKQTITGFEVAQTVRVKIRNIDQVGGVLDTLGSLGISELNGPNFTQDDIEKIKSDARGKAITDAQEKINVLAKQLGVRVVRMTDFSDGGNSQQPQPIMYKAMESSAIGGDAQTASTNDGIFVGDQKTTAQVSITYEVK